jgi:hypothetical protein
MFVFKTGKKFMVSVHDEMDVLWHDTLNGPFFFIRGFFFPWDLDEAFYLRRLTVLNRFYDFNLLHWPGEGLRQAIYHSFGSVSVSANFPPGTQIYSIETPAISGFQYGEPRQLSKTFEPPFSKEPRKISGLWFELFDKANKRDIMLSLTDDSSSRQKLTQSEINTILASFKPVLAASKHGG